MKGVTSMMCPLISPTPSVKLKCRRGVQPAVMWGSRAAQKGRSEKARENWTGLHGWMEGRRWCVVRRTGPELPTLKSLHWPASEPGGSQHNRHCADSLPRLLNKQRDGMWSCLSHPPLLSTCP